MFLFKYLGHIVSIDGIRTDSDKLRALLEMLSPKNLHELRSFLGSCNIIVLLTNFPLNMHLYII